MPAELKVFLLVPLLFGLVGLGFVWFSLRNRRALREFKGRAVRVPGVVTSLRTEQRDIGVNEVNLVRLVFPTVRFVGPDGREVEIEALSGSSPAPAREGQDVVVLVDPADPERVRIEGFWAEGKFVDGCQLAFGLLFAAIGFGILALAIALGALN